MPTPEPSEDRTLPLWLRLALTPGLGPATASKLLSITPDLAELFSMSAAEIASAASVRPALVAELLSDRVAGEAGETLQVAARLGVRILPRSSPDYPRNLLRFSAPPVVLYVRGNLRPSDDLALAVVGPRKPAEYARMMTGQIIPPLCARGITIVSGMAYGIDAEAHHAALQCGGRTLAVLAHGLDLAPSPASNRKLAQGIVDRDQGALISIFPFGMGAEPGNFPRRNEIIAGLSLGTLVVEAGEGSGALITATHTLGLDRPVMACPGDATRSSARGSNKLIADGAALIQNSDDVLRAMEGELRMARRELGIGESARDDESGAGGLRGAASPPSSNPSVAYKPASPLEELIVGALGGDHRTIDYLLGLAAQAGHGQGEVVQTLLNMELNVAIRQLPGRVYCLNQP